MVGLGRTQATLDEVNRARELAPRLSELFKRDTSGESRGAKISAAVVAGTPLAEVREMSEAELDKAAKEGYAIKGAHAQRPRTTLDAPPPTAHLRLSPAHWGPTCTPELRSSPRLPRARPSAAPRLPSLASALGVASRALSLSPSPSPSYAGANSSGGGRPALGEGEKGKYENVVISKGDVLRPCKGIKVGKPDHVPCTKGPNGGPKMLKWGPTQKQQQQCSCGGRPTPP